MFRKTFRQFKGGQKLEECSVCPAGYFCPHSATVSPKVCGTGSYSVSTALQIQALFISSSTLIPRLVRERQRESRWSCWLCGTFCTLPLTALVCTVVSTAPDSLVSVSPIGCCPSFTRNFVVHSVLWLYMYCICHRGLRKLLKGPTAAKLQSVQWRLLTVLP